MKSKKWRRKTFAFDTLAQKIIRCARKRKSPYITIKMGSLKALRQNIHTKIRRLMAFGFCLDFPSTTERPVLKPLRFFVRQRKYTLSVCCVPFRWCLSSIFDEDLVKPIYTTTQRHCIFSTVWRAALSLLSVANTCIMPQWFIDSVVMFSTWFLDILWAASFVAENLLEFYAVLTYQVAQIIEKFHSLTANMFAIFTDDRSTFTPSHFGLFSVLV